MTKKLDELKLKQQFNTQPDNGGLNIFFSPFFIYMPHLKIKYNWSPKNNPRFEGRLTSLRNLGIFSAEKFLKKRNEIKKLHLNKKEKAKIWNEISEELKKEIKVKRGKD